MATSDRSAPQTATTLTGFQRDLLFALAAIGPNKGLEIKTELEDEYGDGINHGRLYPNLDELNTKGHIEKRDGPDRRSNTYEITDRGLETITVRHKWEQACLNGGGD